MRLTALVPLLRTADLKGSVAFYTAVLGFTLDAFEEEWGWASLRRDGIEVMLAAPNAHEPFERPSFTGSLYFRCDDVDAAWQILEDRAEVVYPLESFDYGMREFAVRDNNGYLLQFGQPVAGG